MYNNQVNGKVTGEQALTLSMDFFTITTSVNILQGAFSDASQKALNKLIEVVSQKVQPVLLGVSFSDGGTPPVYTIKLASEHTGCWTAPDLLAAIVANQTQGMGFTNVNTTVTIVSAF